MQQVYLTSSRKASALVCKALSMQLVAHVASKVDASQILQTSHLLACRPAVTSPGTVQPEHQVSIVNGGLCRCTHALMTCYCRHRYGGFVFSGFSCRDADAVLVDREKSTTSYSCRGPGTVSSRSPAAAPKLTRALDAVKVRQRNTQLSFLA